MPRRCKSATFADHSFKVQSMNIADNWTIMPGLFKHNDGVLKDVTKKIKENWLAWIRLQQRNTKREPTTGLDLLHQRFNHFL